MKFTPAVIFNFLLSIALFALGFYWVMVDSFVLPSRYGGMPSTIRAPESYFMAALPFAFALSLLLLTINSEKYKKFCEVVLILGVVLFLVGGLLVAWLFD